MKRAWMAIALALALPAPTLAAGPDKSPAWVEGFHQWSGSGGDGWGVRGLLDFGGTGFYGYGAYSWLESNDAAQTKLRFDEWGLGYHHPITQDTDWLVEAAYRNTDTDGMNLDGARLSLGARHSFSDDVGGFAKLNYYDMSDFDGEVTGTVGMQYRFTRTWGVTGEVEFGEGSPTWLLGLRAHL